MAPLLLSLLLLQSPSDRLHAAIREADADAAEAAIRDLAAGDPAKAGRTLAALLPRNRDRIASLHSAVVSTSRDVYRVETTITLTAFEETEKAAALDRARKSLDEANRRAIAGERIHDLLREAFGQLPRGSIPAVVEAYSSSGSWLLRAELAEGLGRMKAEAELAALLDRETEPAVLAALLEAARTPKALAHLAHANWQVRLAAAGALRGIREGVGPLVAAMKGSDARFRAAAGAALVATTGTSLPADPETWADWWKANGEDWQAGRYVASAPRRAEGPGRTTFFEIPVDSTRVCFVVDRSLSMREESRFAAAKAELKRLLGELPDGARVNVLFFGESSSAFTTTTRVLDAGSRREAVAWVDRMGLQEGTNLLLAMEKAAATVGNAETGRLRDDGPDTIVVLTDGQPTVGRLVDDELVARVAARRLRPLGAIVHTVAFGEPGKGLPLLAKLAGGEHRAK